MADRICPACGAPNTATATFCRVCDTYIDWTDPATTAPSPDPADGGSTSRARRGRRPRRRHRRDPRAEVPVATVGDAVVVVAPGAPGTTTVDLRNASDIVDGIVIHPEAAPSWLVMTHDDAHLMPGESRAVGVTFTTRPGVLVVAQETSVAAGRALVRRPREAHPGGGPRRGPSGGSAPDRVPATRAGAPPGRHRRVVHGVVRQPGGQLPASVPTGAARPGGRRPCALPAARGGRARRRDHRRRRAVRRHRPQSPVATSPGSSRSPGRATTNR